MTWTSAPQPGPLRVCVKVFSGYGGALIDYNWNQTTFAIGLTLNDWSQEARCCTPKPSSCST